MDNDKVSININEARNRLLAGSETSEINKNAIDQILGDIRGAAEQTGGRGSSDFEESTPLSRELTAALADVGVHGFKTHGEVREHIRGLATHLGLTAGATKKTGSRRGLSNRAEEALSRLGTKGRRALSGDEASLLDEAHTLHLGIRHLMRNVPERGNAIVPSITQGRDPSTALTTQRIASQSLDVTPEMKEERNRTEPSGPSYIEPVRLPPGTIESDQPTPGRNPSVRERTRPDYTPRSGRPLVYLPPVPQVATEGLKPGQVRYRQGQRNKQMAENRETAIRLTTEDTERFSRITSLARGAEEAVKAGLMWSFDPDDGGWAHRPIEPPNTPVSTTPPTSTSPKKATKAKTAKAPKKAPLPKDAPRKNAPIPLNEMVGAMLQGEKDVMEARAKYPEQDNPILGFR